MLCSLSSLRMFQRGQRKPAGKAQVPAQEFHGLYVLVERGGGKASGIVAQVGALFEGSGVIVADGLGGDAGHGGRPVPFQKVEQSPRIVGHGLYGGCRIAHGVQPFAERFFYVQKRG